MPFEKGQKKTGGRKKGVKNILPSTAKENIENVINELGGWKGIKEWAEKNQRNKGLLYGWYFKMLPSNVGVEHGGEIEHTVFIMPRPKEKEKKEDGK